MNKFSLLALASLTILAACGDDERKVVYVREQPEYTQPAAAAVAGQQPIIINNVPPAVQQAPGMSAEGAFLLGALGGAAVGNILSQPPMPPRYSYESDRDFYQRQRKYQDTDQVYYEKNQKYIAQLERDVARSKNADLQRQLAAVRQQNRDLKVNAAATVVPPAAIAPIAPTVPMKPPAVITTNTQAIIPNRVNATQVPAPAAATGAYSQPNRVMPTQITISQPKPAIPPAQKPAVATGSYSQPARVVPTQIKVSKPSSTSTSSSGKK